MGGRQPLLRDEPTNHPIKSFTTPLNPRRRPLGRLSLRTAFPVRHTTERRDPGSIRRQTASHTRPETHQNLIHPDKEQRTPNRRTNGVPTRPGPLAQMHAHTDFGHSAIQSPMSRKPPETKTLEDPHSLGANGRPGGDDRDRTDDPLLAKQVLSQLSYAPTPHHQATTTLI